MKPSKLLNKQGLSIDLCHKWVQGDSVAKAACGSPVFSHQGNIRNVIALRNYMTLGLEDFLSKISRPIFLTSGEYSA